MGPAESPAPPLPAPVAVPPPRGVRRWALVTCLLYMATLAVLTVPLAVTAMGDGVAPRPLLAGVAGLADLADAWPYWALLALLGLLEAAFLLAPIQVARGRPVGRARWGFLAATAGLMAGLLGTALFLVVAETVTRDPFGDTPRGIGALAMGVCGWGVWAVVFWRYRRAAGDAAAPLRRVVDRLLTRSLAELLVAVPCHVWARHRDYCCAGCGTFVGLATGLAVMLFAFGPGVFFLFAARLDRLRAGAPARLGAQARDGLVWGAISLVSLAAWPIWTALVSRDDELFLLAGRLAFAVTSAAAAWHLARAWRRREPGRKWLALGTGLATEAALVTAIFGLSWKA